MTLFERLNTNLAEPEVIGNYIEAAFWITVGAIVAVRGGSARPPFYRLPWLASGLFVVFGVSDIVEAQTGAWWRPLWLLAWKGLCLIGLAACYWRYRIIRARSAL